MNFKKSNPFLIVLTAATAGLIIHKILSYFVIPQEFEQAFIYSTPLLYGMFALLSLIIVFLLMQIKKTAPDSVGYGFLALTTVKMVIAYVILRPIIHIHFPKTPAEKANFFVIFICFLAIETFITIRILNNK